MSKKVFVLLLGMLALSACSKRSHFQGYVEGEYRYISAHDSGVVEQLHVRRGDQVKIGQLLFRLEPEPEIDAQKQAEQQVKQNEASVDLALVEFKRQQALYQRKATDKSSLDKAHAAYLEAQAGLKSAQAALSQAQWSHQQKTVFAPVSALVFDTYYLPGELVEANRPVLSLLAPQDIKIVFFVNETQLAQMKIGQKLQIDRGHGQSIISAKVNFISPHAEYTPPVIYSNQTRDKLVYRIEAVPELQKANLFHPGQPVEVIGDALTLSSAR